MVAASGVTGQPTPDRPPPVRTVHHHSCRDPTSHGLIGRLVPRHSHWRGTRGHMFARFAAVRVRVADRATQRVRYMG